ncbi:MAG: DegT/DnrJ/EryC1/StrS family aminotransferase [Actinobacteria bacterium]|jgi:dTDP-4-amino-4,6-dideoxygalactose transaminase|nr:MAG: DegT/DnrJ/EryC1/StrS family aminotransferase [Actinomycetota bacterium]
MRLRSDPTVRRAVPFVNLNRQHEAIAAELDAATTRVRAESAFTLGAEVEAFETEFARFCGVKHAIGVGSGTDALHFALRGFGIGPGDEVITAVNTFAATAEAILMCGARPVFVDIDERTCLLDVARLEAACTARTRAIIPVHLYGQPAEMRTILEIAGRRGLKVIEDACQSHGAMSDGKATGSLGDAGCFSFYPSKNLGAMGDGGIVVTDDDELAEHVRRLRNHGENEERLHIEPGFCSRLHGIQAAILRAKLPALAGWNSQRVEAADSYAEVLSGSSVILPATRSGATHVYHLYVIQTNDRDELRARLDDQRIATGVHYAVPLHQEPAFASLGYGRGDFPVAEHVTSRIVSLPMYPYLERSEIEVIGDAIARARPR